MTKIPAGPVPGHIWNGEQWVPIVPARPWKANCGLPLACPTVRLWLLVLDKPDSLYGGTGRSPSELWVKDWPLVAAVPAEGQSVELWHYQGGGGPDWEVYRVYWSHDGMVNLELKTMVIDPSKEQQDEIVRPLTFKQFSTWYTDTEGGDPRPNLGPGGWRRWTG